VRADASSRVRDLFDVERARLVTLHEGWRGYADASSQRAASYELRRTRAGGLAGAGEVLRGLDAARARRERVAIGPTAAARLLRSIGDAEVRGGEYAPSALVTDDYPLVELALHAPPRMERRGAIAFFYTRAQGELHAPWGGVIAGESYVLEGEEMGRALARLRAALRH
jgi:hypothetical protein